MSIRECAGGLKDFARTSDKWLVKAYGKFCCTIALTVGLALTGMSLAGCGSASLGGTGFSIGGTAFRTTGSIGGTGIDLSGSTVTVGLSDGDDRGDSGP